jgi:hypothetical protein
MSVNCTHSERQVSVEVHVEHVAVVASVGLDVIEPCRQQQDDSFSKSVFLNIDSSQQVTVMQVCSLLLLLLLYSCHQHWRWMLLQHCVAGAGAVGYSANLPMSCKNTKGCIWKSSVELRFSWWQFSSHALLRGVVGGLTK